MLTGPTTMSGLGDAGQFGGARVVEGGAKREGLEDRRRRRDPARRSSELKATLAVKETANEAWAAVKTMRVGVDRVKNASKQRLTKEFENLQWKDGESVDDFAVRVNPREEVKDGRVVRKVQWYRSWKQVAVSIEMLLDLDTMTMEELMLRVAEDADAEDAKEQEVGVERAGQLYLTEHSGRHADGSGTGSADMEV
ncbi:hypothetical protein U9M48_006990 [Paspalum notatum var. saurae]|uniref:Uncharacterized protein n=1 Tax=Paspalum notatum var. saurae TaxID=547442 RepID=A0AAQ3PVR0_PASNO